MKADNGWRIYRTRFLIKATQLTEPFTFVDALGRQHSGHPGDYLVESADGIRRIAPREIFEDVYVPMCAVTDAWSPPFKRDLPLTSVERRSTPRRFPAA